MTNFNKILLVVCCIIINILIISACFGQAVSPGTAPVINPAGGFAIDGNVQANVPTAGVGDWVPGNAGAGGYVLNADGSPVNPGVTFHEVDAYGSVDNIFGGGLKADDNPNAMTWVTNSANGKTNINNVLVHFSTDVNGHQWVIVLADRQTNNGAAYLDFEFLQNTLTVNANGTFSSAGPNNGRTTGDFNLTFSTSGDFTLNVWNGSAYVTYAAPAGSVYGANNAAAVPVSYGAFGSNTYGAGTVIEGAVDITALLGTVNPCTSLGIKTIFIKSKTSPSSSASIVDFVAPIQTVLQLGVANAGTDISKCSSGASTAFTLGGSAVATPGDAVATTRWRVISGAATIDDTTALNTIAHVTSSPATLRLVITTVNGCTATDDIVLTATSSPTSVVVVPGGGNAICSSASVNLSASTNVSGASYLWSPGGQTTSAITVNPGTTQTYSVTVTASNGCSTTSAGKLFTVNPPPVPTLPPASLCEGAYFDLCVSSTGTDLQYEWSNGMTDQCFIVTTEKTYSVLVTDANGCTASASTHIAYQNPPLLAVSKSGPTTFCEGDSVVLTASGATSYLWNTGATTAAITAKTQGLYAVEGSIDGCAISVLIFVTVNPASPISISASGPTIFCQGGSVQLTANGSGTYIWSNNQIGNQIVVNSSGTYSVVGTDGNGCKSSAGKVVTVNPLPTVDIVSPLIVCKNDAAFTLASGSPAGGNYSGTGVSSNMFNPAVGVGSYAITYTYTNANGCASSAVGSISVTDVTPAPGAISGPVNGVCANTSKTYSIAPVNGATSYTWTAPANATISDGQGTANVTVSFNGNFVSGALTVKANSACGASAASLLVVNSLPATPGPIQGNAGPCKKSINVYWVNPVAGATSYTWTVPPGSSIISGQGTASISVKIGNKADNITVVASNGCGNSVAAVKAITIPCREADPNTLEDMDLSNTLVMTVYPNPAKDKLNVLFQSEEENNYMLNVFDMTGRVVIRQSGKANIGDNVISLNMEVAKGIYIVSVTSGEASKQSKIIVE